MTQPNERRRRAVDRLRGLLWGRHLRARPCTHRDQIRDVSPASEGCAACIELDDSWMHLRMCLICGHVGCCDNSKNRHATQHFHTTGHPIIRSAEPGENWMWCYIDQVLLT
jgi:uncharacterized UBP type Zn finger protein